MYCRCGVILFGEGMQGLCLECFPLSKALAMKEDAAMDAANRVSITYGGDVADVLVEDGVNRWLNSGPPL